MRDFPLGAGAQPDAHGGPCTPVARDSDRYVRGSPPGQMSDRRGRKNPGNEAIREKFLPYAITAIDLRQREG